MTKVPASNSVADDRKRNARKVVGSAMPATLVVSHFLGKSADTVEIMRTLGEQATAVQAGDLSGPEAMLINQATGLQCIFSDLATRSSSQTDLAEMEVLMKLALRAQACCRATLQTLAEIKNPRQVAFVKQTNVAQNQQVNNAPALPSRTRKIKPAPNKLIAGDTNGGPEVDTRAAAAAIGNDQRVGAMAVLQRTKNGGR